MLEKEKYICTQHSIKQFQRTHRVYKCVLFNFSLLSAKAIFERRGVQRNNNI